MMTAEERTAWLAERRQFIGGSDLAAIMGLSPWKSPHQVFLEKLDKWEQEVTDKMECGLEQEPIIAAKYAKRFGVELLEPEGPQRHPEYPFIGGNYDRLVLGPDGKPIYGLEIKTTSDYNRDQYGEEGTDHIPDFYLLQCHHYMLVSGLPFWDVAVAIGYSHPKYYRILRNDEMNADIIEVCSTFWQRVIDKVPPPVDGSDGAKIFLNKWYQDSDETKEADDSINELVAAFKKQQGLVEREEGVEEVLRQKIKEQMGGASLLVGPDYKIYWRQSYRKYVDYKKIIAEQKIPVAVIAEHTERRDMGRQFRPYLGKEKKSA